MTALLRVSQLQVGFRHDRAPTTVAVDEVSFTVNRGELVALVGESGCGKSLTGLSLLGLQPATATLGASSSIVFDGLELAGRSDDEFRPLRGARIAMVFQDPMASLNPVMRVGEQIVEAIRAHRRVSRSDARARAIALLGEVGIADPATRVDAWPHQMSGGMRQRVMIAIALAGEPDLLIADEPTTALDVTVQAQILELIDTLRTARGMAVLLITHDLGIVAGRADRVMVMYAGRIVESAATAQLFADPEHPYTRGLFASLPRLDATGARLTAIPGAVPPPDRWPSGCRFHPRCPVSIPRCHTDQPPFAPIHPDHPVACWVAQAEALSA
jgi:oligopeptide/dipeptide ABC transporter ATP-binding protein